MTFLYPLRSNMYQQVARLVLCTICGFVVPFGYVFQHLLSRSKEVGCHLLVLIWGKFLIPTRSFSFFYFLYSPMRLLFRCDHEGFVDIYIIIVSIMTRRAGFSAFKYKDLRSAIKIYLTLSYSNMKWISISFDRSWEELL